MTWVNLDDVYVSTSGGTINGNLAVNGSLTCKNGSTTYNVGSQLATLGNSVSHALQNVDKIFVGSKVSSTCYNSEIQVFADDEFKQLFGRSFDASKDFVGVMNGDWTAVPTYLNSAIYSNSSKIIWTQAANGNTYKQIRINYIVVLCK